MTTTTSHNPCNEPADLVRTFLCSYAPARPDAGLWAPLAADALALVLNAGAMTVDRARKDMETLAATAAYLSETGVELTLENLLSDETLTGFDTHQAEADEALGTRANQRGRLRRLHAVYYGLPWRDGRREDGARIADMTQPAVADKVRALLPADGQPGDTGAAAVQSALEHARRRRRGEDMSPLPPAVWKAARAHATGLQSSITQAELAALATYEVLELERPLFDLVASFGLTRRDLDLGLTVAADLAPKFTPSQVALLRG